MHIGVVTSSLRARLGGAVCEPTATIASKNGYTVNEYADDQGHLINRTGPNGSGPPLAEANPSNFLYWYPSTPDNTNPAAGATAITQVGTEGAAGTLVGDFTELVGGAGQSGCGIESQLESWYRFLIQPDPYASLSSSNNAASWVGVDSTIIQQRHDFLRPDSLVAVVVLSDENDSEIDVRSYTQTGYNFMSHDVAAAARLRRHAPSSRRAPTTARTTPRARAACSMQTGRGVPERRRTQARTTGGTISTCAMCTPRRSTASTRSSPSRATSTASLRRTSPTATASTLRAQGATSARTTATTPCSPQACRRALTRPAVTSTRRCATSRQGSVRQATCSSRISAGCRTSCSRPRRAMGPAPQGLRRPTARRRTRWPLPTG